jgi:hypothetical protein
MIDQQHRRRPRQGMISGAEDGCVLTVADMLDAIHNLPDDAELLFVTSDGRRQNFGRFNKLGEKTLAIEFD